MFGQILGIDRVDTGFSTVFGVNAAVPRQNTLLISEVDVGASIDDLVHCGLQGPSNFILAGFYDLPDLRHISPDPTYQG